MRVLHPSGGWRPGRTAAPLSLTALALAAGVASCAGPAETPLAAMQVSVAYPSIADFQDLPSLMALDRLTEDGYTIVPTFFAQPELAVEALASGKADFGFGSTRTYWAGIQQGGRFTTIMEEASNGWSVVGLTEIVDCADFDGRRLAFHSEGSVAKAMTDAFMRQNCPEITPEILVIPGSENRAAAMLAGQIDVTPLEPADVVQLLQKAPDRFHVVVDFAASLPDLMTSGIYVGLDYAAEHPHAVQDLITALLITHRRLAADPTLLIEEATTRLGIDAASVPAILEAHLRIDSWDVNGGLTREAVEYSLDFYMQNASLEPGLTPDDVADLSYLAAVLEAMGRAPEP